MQYEIEFTETGPADVEITLAGPASPSRLREFSEKLEQDPRFRPQLTMLVDISSLDASELENAHIGEFARRIVARDWHSPPRAVAIIAATDETLRGAEAYRAYLGGSKSNRHIVSSRAEGLAWLAMQRNHS